MITRRGEKVALDIRSRDPLDRPLWYKFMAEQGEFLLKMKGYVSYLEHLGNLKSLCL